MCWYCKMCYCCSKVWDAPPGPVKFDRAGPTEPQAGAPVIHVDVCGNCTDLGEDCSSLTCAVCTSGVWLHMVPEVTPTLLKASRDSYWMMYTIRNIESLPVGRKILQTNPRIWCSGTGRKVEGKYFCFGGFCCNSVESL